MTKMNCGLLVLGLALFMPGRAHAATEGFHPLQRVASIVRDIRQTIANARQAVAEQSPLQILHNYTDSKGKSLAHSDLTYAFLHLKVELERPEDFKLNSNEVTRKLNNAAERLLDTAKADAHKYDDPAADPTELYQALYALGKLSGRLDHQPFCNQRTQAEFYGKKLTREKLAQAESRINLMLWTMRRHHGFQD
jgi:hypothetical protein